MRRVLLAEPERFVIEEVQIPEPKANEVIVKVERSGICGSDIHMYHGVSPIQPPLVMGHEFAGTIDALGSQVTDFEIGDRVVVEPGVQCGECTYCQSGRYNLCPYQYTIGGYREHDGGYADYVRVPANRVVPLPDEMSFEVGVMVEPVACAMHALDVADIRSGDTVLIIGAGTIGLLIAQAVRMAGAETVVVTDIVPERLELAKQLGADAVVNAQEMDLVTWAKEKYGLGGVHRVFDTVSISQTFKQALEIVRRGGRIIDVGVSTKPVEWNLNALLLEVEITGMNMYVRRNFDQAVEAIMNGHIQVEPLISAVYPLSDIDKAYDELLANQDQFIKVMLAPQEG